MKQENKERSSTIYIGKGIIISAIVITASLGFILGFFVGKSFRPNNTEISENAGNIEAEKQLANTQPLSITQQENNSSQPAESSQTNTTTKQQPQSSETIQQNKGQTKLKEESISQPHKDSQIKNNQTKEADLNSKSKKYTVQVEAFKNQEAAEELKNKLIKKGYKAFVIISDKRNNNKLYKVLVGEFATRKEAEILSIKIRKVEKLHNAFVTFKK